MNTKILFSHTLARCMHSDWSGAWERHKALIRFWSSQPITFRWQLLVTLHCRDALEFLRIHDCWWISQVACCVS